MVTKNLNLLLLSGNILLLYHLTVGQETNVVLQQGTVVGLKIFPETSRVPVYSFLGIPYAEPPIENLRFSPPIPHRGWNKTLFARDFKQICPQIEANIYEDELLNHNRQRDKSQDPEDCLFLNIWTPETAFRYGNMPILVIITGEEMAFDWSENRPTGLDLSSDGIIVVTVQYRTNILGWFTLENQEAPGNIGLLDQHLALIWIRDNIKKFGGDPEKVTILGHGTGGAANVMAHLVSRRAKTLFSKAIIMSGTILSSYSFQLNSPTSSPSQQIIRNLACDGMSAAKVLECMQKKSLSDLMKSFENVYKNGNYTSLLGPVVDDYLQMDKQYISEDPRKLLSSNEFNKIPIIIGICNNEGAFLRDQWVDLARHGYGSLRKYIERTSIGNILEHFSFTGFGEIQIRETINWHFFDRIQKTPAYLLNALLRLISETKFEVPFFETIELLSNADDSRVNGSLESDLYFSVNSLGNKTLNDIISRRLEKSDTRLKRQVKEESKLFVYSFQQSGSIDMKGKVNFFGGASHSTDLPFLLGPSLFQQIGRRRLNQAEDKLCKKIRELFSEFIKSGNPTPGRLFDSWFPYSSSQKYIKIIGTKNEITNTNSDNFGFEKNLPQIEKLLSTHPGIDIPTPSNPYNLNNNQNNESRISKNLGYIEDRNSEYYSYLNKISSFWRILLPKIYKNLNEIEEESRQDAEGRHFESTEIGSPKFKHAFFSMLTLVCLLLAILGICVYILKKNHKNIDTSML